MGWIAGVRFPARANIYSFSISSTQVLRSTHPPTQWIPNALSPRVKRSGRESDHSPPSSADLKNSGAVPLLNHTSLCRPTWSLTHRDIFIFCFYQHYVGQFSLWERYFWQYLDSPFVQILGEPPSVQKIRSSSPAIVTNIKLKGKSYRTWQCIIWKVSTTFRRWPASSLGCDTVRIGREIQRDYKEHCKEFLLPVSNLKGDRIKINYQIGERTFRFG
jgi:hypothetical protein